MKTITKIRILGLDFFNGDVTDVVTSLQSGGLLVVPAAPALVKINKDHAYYESLAHADIIIPDSGFMSLLWNLGHKQKINRISGLEFLITFLENKEVRCKPDFFLVNPSSKDSFSNTKYLNSRGFLMSPDMSYVAPFYKQPDIEDRSLLAILEKNQPKYIIINIGGGTQEKLGYYLKKNLSYKPAIICTGAAIAFLTGQQVPIPMWADRLYMGWLFRCVENPSLYIPRYFNAFKLARMIMASKKYSIV